MRKSSHITETVPSSATSTVPSNEWVERPDPIGSLHYLEVAGWPDPYFGLTLMLSQLVLTGVPLIDVTNVYGTVGLPTTDLPTREPGSLSGFTAIRSKISMP